MAMRALIKMQDRRLFNEAEIKRISPLMHELTESDNLEFCAGAIQILLAFRDSNPTKLIGPIIRVLEESRNAQLLKNLLDGMKTFDLKFCKFEKN